MGTSINKIHFGKRQLNTNEISQLENFSSQNCSQFQVRKTNNQFIIIRTKSLLLNLLFNIPPTINEEIYVYNTQGRLLKKNLV